MICRISDLHAETGDPAVKWTCHSFDGKWLGYFSDEEVEAWR